LNYNDTIIPPNPQQDSEIKTADVENCIDDLNYFHFKKLKSNIPTFEKKHTPYDDYNEDDYFIVHTDWLIRKCDNFNKENLEKNRDSS
jgi:hypothetical protein